VNLILFSSSYPYAHGGEANFLNIEVQYLLKSFNRVVVVPEKCEGDIPADCAGAEVDVSYAKMLASKNMLDLFQVGISSKIFRQGLLEQNYPRFSFTALRRLIAISGKAELTRRWVLDWLSQRGWGGKDCLFYTYWFDHASIGIGFAGEQYPGIRLVSRAHGYDIYEEQYYNPPFWPGRRSALQRMDRIFSASKAGEEYLRVRYPEFTHLYETAFLGVSDPGFLNHASTDGIIRVVSCSMIRPEKRVERILKGVLRAAQARPQQRIEWTHIGNGAASAELQKTADDQFPANAKASFTEYTNNAALMKLYRDRSFDVFINVSKTEGIPVSIMEAISCGIPVIATAVGGNVEIVSDQNGVLLSKEPTAEEISSALFYFIDRPEEARRKRAGSRKMWQTQYNAQINFPAFAEKLASLRSAP
jgi:glycosyltransferase involved in cell wall biosynthesis